MVESDVNDDVREDSDVSGHRLPQFYLVKSLGDLSHKIPSSMLAACATTKRGEVPCRNSAGKVDVETCEVGTQTELTAPLTLDAEAQTSVTGGSAKYRPRGGEAAASCCLPGTWH